MQEYNQETVQALKDVYQSAKSGSYDIYVVFIEKGANLLCQNGYLGFIAPHKFFNAGYGRNLRQFLSRQKLVRKVVHFQDFQVFEKATTYTCLLFLQKCENKNIEVAKVERAHFLPQSLQSLSFEIINSDNWTSENWTIVPTRSTAILRKMDTNPKLHEITSNIFQGPKSGADDVFIFELLSQSEKVAICYSHSIGGKFKIENQILRKYIKGKNLRRYYVDYSANEYTIFPYDRAGKLFSQEVLRNKHPLAFSYLSLPQNKKILCSRERGRFKEQWWAYSRPQNMGIVFSLKILTPFNAFRNSFALDNKGDFVFSAGVSGAYGILIRSDVGIANEYLLVLLNSRLSEFFIRNTSTCLRGGFYSYENKYIKNIPIRTIDFHNPDDVSKHDRMVKLVEQMLDLHKQLVAAKIPDEKTKIQRQIDTTDKQIDNLVYDLYGLTEEEIKIVEESLNNDR